MYQFIQRQWFLIGLLILIPGGFWLGMSLQTERVSSLSQGAAGVAGKLVVIVVLFLMSFTLDTRKLVDAACSPGPVLWATLVNAGLIPLLGLLVMRWQLSKDFGVGVLVAASVPCTMAAASVWTRKAFGNDAVSLLVTLVTNSLCFLVVPFWLQAGLGQNVEMNVWDLMFRLFQSALIPIAMGQLFRVPRVMAEFADRMKALLGTFAQCCILLMVFWAAVQGGPQLLNGGLNVSHPAAIGVAWISCIGLHLLGLAAGLLGAVLFRFKRPDAVAVAFSSSQKTLPIGLYIVTTLLAHLAIPLAVFPMLMFHVSQLFIDALLIAPLARWGRQAPE